MMKVVCITLSCFCPTLLTGHAEPLVAANSQARPLSQLSAHSSACGPVCLLNALRLGSNKWQKFERQLPGVSDKAKIYHIIRHYGARPSLLLNQQTRWRDSTGMNPTDLTKTGNEIAYGLFTPKLKLETFIIDDPSKATEHLEKLHKYLTKSLQKGFPPILGVTRYVRETQGNGHAQISWRPIKSHYILLTHLHNLPDLSKPSTTLPVIEFDYIDPWGAERLKGHFTYTKDTFLKTPTTQFPFPQIITRLPSSGVGRRGVKFGQQSHIVLTSAIGAF